MNAIINSSIRFNLEPPEMVVFSTHMPNPGLAPNVSQSSAKNVPQLNQVSPQAPMGNAPGQMPPPSSLGQAQTSIPGQPPAGEQDKSMVLKALVDYLKTSQKAQAGTTQQQAPMTPPVPMGGGDQYMGGGYPNNMGGCKMNQMGGAMQGQYGKGTNQNRDYMTYKDPYLKGMF